MSYFTYEEFKFWKGCEGEKVKKTDEKYKKLTNIYEKIDKLAEKITSDYSDKSLKKIMKKPTNQSNIIEKYQWAKIYPNDKMRNIEKLAFTIGINSNIEFTVKIDTIQCGIEGDKNPIRKKYEEYRGNPEESEIVKGLKSEELLTKTFDDLVIYSVEQIKSLEKHYWKLVEILELNTININNILNFINIEYPIRYPDFLKYKFQNRENATEYYNEEIDYKLNLVKEVNELRQTIIVPNVDEEEVFNKIIRIYTKNSLVAHHTVNILDIILKQNSLTNDFVTLFIKLFKSNDDIKNVSGWIDEYVNLLTDIRKKYKTDKNYKVSISWDLITLFPFLLFPSTHIFLKPGAFKNFIKFTNIPYNYNPKPSGERYLEFLNIIEKIVNELKKNDFQIKDMIDIQTLIWNINLNEEIKGETMQKNEKIININQSNVNTNGLLPSKNIILYGPPGTGKTYKINNEYSELFANSDKKNYTLCTFHQSYSYEDFIEGIKPIMDKKSDNIKYEIKDGIFKQCCNEALKLTGYQGNINEFCSQIKRDREISEKYFNNNTLEYALFIDEINRGNISKIFGELITLIEDDKRLGEENQIIVELPYSNEYFCIPPNLFIIGTMNTADRSIALIDTALRRRFSFIEMLPEYEINELKDLVVNDIIISKLLRKINERIEFLYDRDHIIGHSFFIKLNKMEESKKYPKLCKIFQNKIIPLLQEYFHDDWEKIQIVLGDFIEQLHNEKEPEYFKDEINKIRLIQSCKFVEKKIIGFDHDDYEDTLNFKVNPDLNTSSISSKAFIKIYQPEIIKNKLNNNEEESISNV